MKRWMWATKFRIMAKPKVIKDYEKLPTTLVEQIKLKYPMGYEDSLISYTDKEGKQRLALPFETDDYSYLIRMTVKEARQIIKDDDDFDDNGYLKDDVFDDFKDEYGVDEVDEESEEQPELD